MNLMKFIFSSTLIIMCYDSKFTNADDPSELSEIKLPRNCSYTWQDYSVLNKALQRALFFLDKFAENLLMDAVVGTRVVEAQLGAVLKSHHSLPHSINDDLVHLIKEAKYIGEKIIPNIRDSGFLSPVKWTVQSEWVKTPALWEWPLAGENWEDESVMRFHEPPEGINTRDIFTAKETIFGSVSDICIYEIANCDSYGYSDVCDYYFHANASTLYSLTHQILYTMIGVKHKCFNIRNEASWRNWQEHLCGKVWLEATSIALNGFPAEFRDLFMEQVMVCGMLGYPNFLQKEWLHAILSWQSTHTYGCFLDERTADKRELIWHELFQMPEKNEICQVHFTALGAGVLSMHIRYFLHTCLSDY